MSDFFSIFLMAVMCAAVGFSYWSKNKYAFKSSCVAFLGVSALLIVNGSVFNLQNSIAFSFSPLASFLVINVSICCVFFALWLRVSKTHFGSNQEKNLLMKQYSFDHINDAVFWVDKQSIICDVNDRACELLGYKKSELLNASVIDIDKSINPDDWDTNWAAVKSQKMSRFAANYTRRDGSTFPVETTIGFFEYEGQEFFCAITRDMTVQKAIHERLEYQANHDPLTNLYNRSEFERRLSELVEEVKVNDKPCVLLYLDLDKFKEVNDASGHVAGDELLRQVSALIGRTVRRDDTLARLGGDEFGIIMEGCDLREAARVATKIKEVVRQYSFSWEDNNFRIGVSIGLTAIAKTTFNSTEIIKRADEACYKAKQKGRNSIYIFHPDEESGGADCQETQWLPRLQKAIDDDLFKIYGQRISSLNDSQSLQLEVLVRMTDGEEKVIMPGAFLPAAERYNMAVDLDKWVVSHALAIVSNNPEMSKQLDFITINLSSQSIIDETMCAFIETQIHHSGVPGSKVCFEITESAVVSCLSKAQNFISNIKKLGCRFILDDFGKGMSSFGFLKQLPVDYLKIDGLLVRGMAASPTDRAMVQSINNIGHSMGIKTIAEYVEKPDIPNQLEDLGVDYMQGYAVDVPRPLESFAATLSDRENSSLST